MTYRLNGRDRAHVDEFVCGRFRCRVQIARFRTATLQGYDAQWVVFVHRFMP